jgi:thiol-disulfide isomerase/thioredoxin
MNWYPSEHASLNKLTNWRVPLNFYNYQKSNLPLKEEQLISTYQIEMFINQYLFGYVANHIYEENKDALDNNPESLYQDSLWVNGIIKYTDNSLLRQLVLTERIRRNLDKQYISMFENYQDIIHQTITAPFLIKPLQEKFAKIKEQLEHPEISSNAILRDMRGTEIESIMDSILLKNKGKVVYLDFWGPWCSACVKELPYSKSLMEELDKAKISFVFFCIDSDYKSWKAKISKLKLDGQHYFFDKKQSTELRKVFKINGVPRYILLNKVGIITDQIAKRPSDPKLKVELLKLMKEK